MRSLLTATSIFMAIEASAQAQMTAPALGFSGSAALDDTGSFAGIALLKPVVVASPTGATTASSQASLVPADAVRAFLRASGVNADGTSTDAKASVVRVICVRK